MFDTLVHEASHSLLFGLSAEEALTSNGDERYPSSVRSDERPIDGIFHACFVTTRVHSAIQRAIANAVLAPEETSEALEHQDYNGKAAVETLEVLTNHARTTATGEAILSTIRAYWSNQPAGR
jgi:HEXXH motif-containing protein